MPVDPEAAKYAENRFNQRFEDEIRPAYRQRLSEAVARWNPSPQAFFSGSQAKGFIAVEARYAREAAYAQAESLIEALDKAGLPFNDDAFRKALEDTKRLLQNQSEYSYRKVISHFNVAAIPNDALKALEQDVDNEMAHIHDSILRFLKVKLQETVLTARKAKQPVNLEDEDRTFAKLAIEEARQSISEPDGKPHPMVGAAVVKNGQVLSSAHRGEDSGNHAEFTALDKKLADEAVFGATVYTTLEPCTTRNHPKIPCVKRIIDRKVARVVVGMLDPDPRITGRGMLALRNANIAIDLFPPDLMTEVEELNREFKRLHEQQSQPQLQTSKVSPKDSIREKLPTLLDLFRNDFSNALKMSDNEPAITINWLDASTTKIRRQVYMDFPAKTKFIGFYVLAAVPPSADISGNKTFSACMKLLEANAVEQAFEHVSKQVAILAGREGQMTSIGELTFSGRVLIYHDEFLSIPQKADIIRAYAAKNLDVQFMGTDYLGSQVVAWHQKHDGK
jgi:pyrimidine deaminase RibD-like protein